jgi:GNAT superfamily N-acetyltransferase
LFLFFFVFLCFSLGGSENMPYTKRVLASGTIREVEEPEGRAAFHTHGSVTDMSIFVEEEHRGQKWARRLVQALLLEAKREGFSVEHVYIDADASQGFWDHVGFEVNPYYDNVSEPELYGYEKRVEWERLQQFAKW